MFLPHRIERGREGSYHIEWNEGGEVSSAQNRWREERFVPHRIERRRGGYNKLG